MTLLPIDVKKESKEDLLFILFLWLRLLLFLLINLDFSLNFDKLNILIGYSVEFVVLYIKEKLSISNSFFLYLSLYSDSSRDKNIGLILGVLWNSLGLFIGNLFPSFSAKIL